jgi:hypothetical protein
MWIVIFSSSLKRALTGFRTTKLVYSQPRWWENCVMSRDYSDLWRHQISWFEQYNDELYCGLIRNGPEEVNMLLLYESTSLVSFVFPEEPLHRIQTTGADHITMCPWSKCLNSSDWSTGANLQDWTGTYFFQTLVWTHTHTHHIIAQCPWSELEAMFTKVLSIRVLMWSL